MQHGSARPLAVKYISDQGLRHMAQGSPSVLRFRLSPASVAPDASSVTPSLRPMACAASIAACSSAWFCSNSELSARAMPNPSSSNTSRCRCTSRTPMESARRMNSGSSCTVSFMPVSHSDTRGVEASCSIWYSVSLRTSRTMRPKKSLPRTIL